MEGVKTLKDLIFAGYTGPPHPEIMDLPIMSERSAVVESRKVVYG